MSTRYWVGGSGTWDTTTTTHWSDSSGGSGGFSVPTSSDDVIFDANSDGGINVQISFSTTPSCLNLDLTGFVGQFTTSTTGALKIYGSFTGSSNVSYYGKFTFLFYATSSGKTITCSGYMPPCVFDGVGGGWTVVNNFDMSPYSENKGWSGEPIIIQNGTISFTGDVNIGELVAYTGTATLNMGSGTWSIGNTYSSDGLTLIEIDNDITLTLNAETSTLKLYNSNSDSGDPRIISAIDLSFYNVWLTGTKTNPFLFYNVSYSFNDIKIDAGKTIKFDAGTTQTTNTLTSSGVPGNLTYLGSTSASPFTLVKSGGGTQTIPYLSVSYCIGSPISTWYGGIGTLDGGNNTNWIFTYLPDIVISDSINITENLNNLNQLGDIIESVTLDSTTGGPNFLTGNVNHFSFGQTFTPSTSGPITSVKFYVNKRGTPPYNVYAKLFDLDSQSFSGLPTGTPLATSDPVYQSNLRTNPSYSVVNFIFSGDNQYNVQVGKYYAITFYAPDGSSGNYAQIGWNGNSGHHTGKAIYYNSATSYLWTTLGTAAVIFTLYSDTLFDQINITEDIVIHNFLNIDVSDSLNITEYSILDNQLNGVDVNDALNITDNLSIKIDSFIFDFDILSISENIDRTPSTLSILVIDSLSIFENLNVPGIFYFSDQLDLIENITISLSSPIIDVSDLLNLTEDIVNEYVSIIIVSDSISIVDNFGKESVFYVSVHDTLDILDNITLCNFNNITIFDLVNTSELLFFESFKFSPSPGNSQPIGGKSVVTFVASASRSSYSKPIGGEWEIIKPRGDKGRSL